MHTALLFSLAVSGIVLVGGLFAIVFGVRGAPVAIEDENGFHVVREQSGRSAITSGAMTLES